MMMTAMSAQITLKYWQLEKARSFYGKLVNKIRMQTKLKIQKRMSMRTKKISYKMLHRQRISTIHFAVF